MTAATLPLPASGDTVTSVLGDFWTDGINYGGATSHGAGAPTGTGTSGESYYDTTNKVQYRSNGIAWLLVPDLPSAWTAVTFTNSWVNYVGYVTQYRKVGDEVQIRGLIKNGTMTTAAFTLPVGFRPYQEETFTELSNVALGSVSVSTAGAVTIQTGSNVYIYLSGIRFSTVA